MSLDVDPTIDHFYECQLYSRTLQLAEDGVTFKTVVHDRPGVIGYYPKVYKGMKPFVYES